VVITDVMSNVSIDGSSTPAGEPEDDFFSSWDKPSIKRPTPPASRTATPPVVGRTPSPFLNAGNSNGNGIARSSSPLVNVEGAGSAAPAHSRITSSAALRKGTTTGAGPRRLKKRPKELQSLVMIQRPRKLLRKPPSPRKPQTSQRLFRLLR
jgi:ADP-ribosylation factor GTPase-activating protein 2/3